MQPTGHLRLALVGAGAVARSHARAAQAVESAEIVAVCDPSEEALGALSAQLAGARTYRSVSRMLEDEELDLVILCNWAADHASVGCAVAESGRTRAVLCEKPLALGTADARRFVEVCRSQGVLLAEAFKFRHHPMHQAVAGRLAAGRIGELQAVRSTFCHRVKSSARDPRNVWRHNAKKGGGSIFDLGCYGIHHARWLFGSEPVSVFATAQQGPEVDESATILLEFEGRRTAQITCSFNAWRHQEVDVMGASGTLHIPRAWNTDNRPVRAVHRCQDGEEILEFGAVDQFAEQLRGFCASLATGDPFCISPEDSIHQARAVEAALDSARTRTIVEI